MSENDTTLPAEADKPRRRARPLPEPVEALTAAVEPTEADHDEPVVWAPPVISLSAVADGEKSAVAAVAEALVTAGFLDALAGPFREGYARMQRHLGYGIVQSNGIPDADSLTWLSLRTQTFTTAD